jgi:hypothetical protein
MSNNITGQYIHSNVRQHYWSVQPWLIRPDLLLWKCGIIRGVASLKENKINSILLFEYFSASDIPVWHDKRGGLWWDWHWMRAITVHTQYIPCELTGINQIFKLKECKVFPDDFTVMSNNITDQYIHCNVKQHYWSLHTQ